MSPLHILVRTLVAYLFLLAMLRASGKRVVAEATGMQLVLAILIGDLVDDAMFGAVPFAQFVVAAGSLTLAQVLTGVAAYHDLRIWKLVEGVPPLLIQNGIPRRDALRRQRVSRKELASLLRLRGISAARWAEIKRARLEEEGVVGIVLHEWAKPAQRRDAEWVRARRRS
ncbi:MAG: DUF421 domain-containing protein [Gemmatimonadota bacterium]|nr:DUF421 domain-containing protein [Gemmatimonadota bacterium]